MTTLILAGIAALAFALFAAGFLAGHAAGRLYGQSEAWDDAVREEEAALEALRRIR